MKKYAIIVGAGTGSRMGEAIPKQFLQLEGKPMLWYAVKSFCEAFEDVEIILVLPTAWLDRTRSIMEHLELKCPLHFCSGGETRFHSVREGLAYVKEESIVFVHDAVRCLLTPELIHRCYESALQNGSAIPVIDSKDSVRFVTGEANQAVERHLVKLVQTPQTFKSEIILQAYRAAFHESFTDEATVVESMGMTVSLVRGEEQNIKITTPVDMLIAARWLSARHHTG